MSSKYILTVPIDRKYLRTHVGTNHRCALLRPAACGLVAEHAHATTAVVAAAAAKLRANYRRIRVVRAVAT